MKISRNKLLVLGLIVLVGIAIAVAVLMMQDKSQNKDTGRGQCMTVRGDGDFAPEGKVIEVCPK